MSTIGSSSTGSPHSHCKSLKNNGSRNQSPRSGLDRGEPRLRPGISGRNSNASSRLSGNMSTLQEDLMKLIDPDYNLDSSFIVSFASSCIKKIVMTHNCNKLLFTTGYKRNKKESIQRERIEC